MGDLGQVLDEPRSGPASCRRRPARASGRHLPAHPRAEVLAHRCTIIFCNARRLAERLAARLNELAEAEGVDAGVSGELVKAHHGSLAREQRVVIEDQLKRGELRGLVATSSLELGIDMGAVDLVIQVESPGAVSRGLQRIGRAGHRSASRARARSSRSTAATCSRPRSSRGACTTGSSSPPATCATRSTCWPSRSWPWPRWRSGRSTSSPPLVRRCAGFAELTDDVLANRARPAGRALPERGVRRAAAPHRVGPGGRAAPGARRRPRAWPSRAAAPSPTGGCSACSCPTARGSASSTRRWSTRAGPARRSCSAPPPGGSRTSRSSGSSSSPAPGQPGKMPFWHGDRPGRPLELGRALGAFVREIRGPAPDVAVARPASTDYGLDELGGRQRRAATSTSRPRRTGVVPDDRTVVVERFRDEIGDWRVCLLSPFGTPVHAPWAMAIEQRLIERYGMAVETMWSDDGIVHPPARGGRRHTRRRAPDRPGRDRRAGHVGAARHVAVLARASGSARHGRCCCPGAGPTAARRCGSSASGPPTCWRWRPSTRPSRSCSRPAGSACRTCSTCPPCAAVLADLRSRRVRVVTVDTQKASPFAQSLLFNWIAAYMYEGDAPLAERRAAALALDRDLLRELLGAEELRELLDADVLADLELELQCLTDERRARVGRRAPRPAAPAGRPDAAPRSTCARGLTAGGRLAGRRSWPSVGPSWCGSPARSASSPPRTRPATATRSGARCRSGCRRRSPIRSSARSSSSWPATPAPTGRSSPTRAGSPPRRAARAGAGGLAAARGRGPARAGRVPARRRRARVVRRRGAAPAAPALAGRAAPGGRAGRARRRSPASCRPGRASAPAGAAWTRSSRPSACCRARRSRRRSLDGDVLARRVQGYRPTDLDELCTSGDVVWMGAGAARGARRPGAAVLPRPGRTCWPRARLDADAPDGPSARRAAGPPRLGGARASGADLRAADAGRHGDRAAGRPVGPGVGRRGHQRLAGAAAGAAWPARRSARPAASAGQSRGGPGPAPARAAHPDRAAGRRRPVVAGRAAARSRRADGHRGGSRHGRCSSSSATAC